MANWEEIAEFANGTACSEEELVNHFDLSDSENIELLAKIEENEVHRCETCGRWVESSELGQRIGSTVECNYCNEWSTWGEDEEDDDSDE